MSSLDALKSEYEKLEQWLFEQAFPLWSSTGVDLEQGGFFEKINEAGQAIEMPRRARLVGRQIYAFATAQRMGWTGPAAEIVSHGISFLKSHYIQPDHSILSVVHPDGTPVRSAFDLYDYAFVLFGLAAAATVRNDHEDLAALARAIRERMTAGWKHPIAGFEESMPRSLPLKANPHMHIFEASLAWIGVGPQAGDKGWEILADEIAELCLAKFLHSENGCLREFFDGDWNAAAGEEGRIVEPGHQYEWAWLLIRWGLMRSRPDAIAAARRLIDIAETKGTDPARGIALNELFDDFTVRDGKARLWPQTERIKAWLALASIAVDPQKRDEAFDHTTVALQGLSKYLTYPVEGAWHEMIGENGLFLPEPPRASSLYHITCAASEIWRSLYAVHSGSETGSDTN